MPAKSEKQRKFMALVRAYKRGEHKGEVSDEVKEAAASMSDEDLTDFMKKDAADGADTSYEGKLKATKAVGSMAVSGVVGLAKYLANRRARQKKGDTIPHRSMAEIQAEQAKAGEAFLAKNKPKAKAAPVNAFGKQQAPLDHVKPKERKPAFNSDMKVEPTPQKKEPTVAKLDKKAALEAKIDARLHKRAEGCSTKNRRKGRRAHKRAKYAATIKKTAGIMDMLKPQSVEADRILTPEQIEQAQALGINPDDLDQHAQEHGMTVEDVAAELARRQAIPKEGSLADVTVPKEAFTLIDQAVEIMRKEAMSTEEAR